MGSICPRLYHSIKNSVVIHGLVPLTSVELPKYRHRLVLVRRMDRMIMLVLVGIHEYRLVAKCRELDFAVDDGEGVAWTSHQSCSTRLTGFLQSYSTFTYRGLDGSRALV